MTAESGEDTAVSESTESSVLDSDRDDEDVAGSGVDLFEKYGESEIFDDPDSLQDTYKPDEIRFRDDQEKELFHRIKRIKDGQKPKNAFLKGPNGTGKTLLTDHITQAVLSHPNVDDLRLVNVNCSHCKSEVDVCKAIANQILPLGEEVPSSGLSDQEYLKRLFAAIEDVSESTVLLVLDDVTRVDSLNDILYEVCRGGHHGMLLDETDVSVIVTANRMSFYDNLRDDVYSSLSGKGVIKFSPYEQPELREILQQRAEIAFLDGSISEGEIRFAASLAAKKQGDARYGLDILEQAGEIAEMENATTVTEEHISEARKKIDTGRLSSKLLEYNLSTELLIAVIAILDMDSDRSATTTQIQSLHKDLCDRFGMNAYVKNTYYKKYPHLVRHGLIRTQRMNDKSAKAYETVYPAERYIEAVSDELKRQLFHEEYGELDPTEFENIEIE